MPATKLENILVEVAKSMDCFKKGCCWEFCTRASTALLAAGITDFTVVLGWVHRSWGFRYFWEQHIWLEKDGQKFDYTLGQFTDFLRYAPRIKERLTPAEYLARPEFKLEKGIPCSEESPCGV